MSAPGRGQALGERGRIQVLGTSSPAAPHILLVGETVHQPGLRVSVLKNVSGVGGHTERDEDDKRGALSSGAEGLARGVWVRRIHLLQKLDCHKTQVQGRSRVCSGLCNLREYS